VDNRKVVYLDSILQCYKNEWIFDRFSGDNTIMGFAEFKNTRRDCETFEWKSKLIYRYKVMEKSKALLIGLNYVGSQNELHGCWNDVKEIGNLLVTRYGFEQKNVDVIRDETPEGIIATTKSSILGKIYELAKQSIEEDMDMVVFHYSGHGYYQFDEDGDEPDRRDEGICPSDYRLNGLLIDDDMSKAFEKFNPKTIIFVIMDCCHSQSMLDLPYEYYDGRMIKGIPTTQEGVPRIVMISGCTDPDVSADAYDSRTGNSGGALTMCLTKALTDNETENVLSVHHRVLLYLRQSRYTQIPILSSTFPLTEDIHLFKA
jgi:metacaspase-1